MICSFVYEVLALVSGPSYFKNLTFLFKTIRGSWFLHVAQLYLYLANEYVLDLEMLTDTQDI
jgi:hypothetical protein